MHMGSLRKEHAPVPIDAAFFGEAGPLSLFFAGRAFFREPIGFDSGLPDFLK